MKKILLALALILPITVQANEKDDCMESWKKFIFYGHLEGGLFCDFIGGVSKQYAPTDKCLMITSQEERSAAIDAISSQVLADSKRMGNKAYCESQRQAYIDLIKQ